MRNSSRLSIFAYDITRCVFNVDGDMSSSQIFLMVFATEFPFKYREILFSVVLQTKKPWMIQYSLTELLRATQKINPHYPGIFQVKFTFRFRTFAWMDSYRLPLHLELFAEGWKRLKNVCRVDSPILDYSLNTS